MELEKKIPTGYAPRYWAPHGRDGHFLKKCREMKPGMMAMEQADGIGFELRKEG